MHAWPRAIPGLVWGSGRRPLTVAQTETHAPSCCRRWKRLRRGVGREKREGRAGHAVQLGLRLAARTTPARPGRWWARTRPRAKSVWEPAWRRLSEAGPRGRGGRRGVELLLENESQDARLKGRERNGAPTPLQPSNSADQPPKPVVTSDSPSLTGEPRGAGRPPPPGSGLGAHAFTQRPDARGRRSGHCAWPFRGPHGHFPRTLRKSLCAFSLLSVLIFL